LQSKNKTYINNEIMEEKNDKQIEENKLSTELMNQIIEEEVEMEERIIEEMITNKEQN